MYPKMSVEASDMSKFALTNAALIRRADSMGANVLSQIAGIFKSLVTFITTE